jgi:MFS transporter, YNFM family, putative membrane transport protein
VLVYFTVRSTVPMMPLDGAPASALSAARQHLRNRPLMAAFGIGFCILFAFIGTFTYVNFVLVRAPLSLSPMALGLVYFVFLPSIITTPFAGQAAQRLGTRTTLWASLALTGLGLPLLLAPTLPVVMIGLMLVGIGTFFAQAVATGLVGRAALADRGSASGIYLACYFAGGLVGSAVLGQLFDTYGWPACVLGIALSLFVASLLTFQVKKAALMVYTFAFGAGSNIP